MHSLEPTGERTVPGVADESYWFARHLVAYEWVATHLAERIRGGVVVDAGAGEGYGIAHLARTGARLALGIELDAEAAHHAAAAYASASNPDRSAAHPGVAVARANLAALPIADRRCDVVISLQVIEHLWSLAAFLRDCRRILRPGASLVVSTPNRPVFSPGLARGEKPTNPFHVEEFDADQVHDLLAATGFGGIRIFGVEHGPRLLSWEAEHGPLVAAQVDAVLSGVWPPALREFVASITAADFVVTPRVGAGTHDLLAVANA